MAEEHNKRLARTKMPDGTLIERPWTPSERYQLYRDGFRHGAWGARPGKEQEGLGAYDRGYADGKAALASALTAYAKEIGYEPSILRDAPAEPKPDEKNICPSCREPWANCQQWRSCME